MVARTMHYRMNSEKINYFLYISLVSKTFNANGFDYRYDSDIVFDLSYSYFITQI